MSKVISILKDFGWVAVTLLLIVVGLVMLVALVALVILVVLAIPVCIVLLIGEAVVTFIDCKYEERKKSNSADMCGEESAEDSASNSDAARDTAGAESAGSDDEY
jgi:Na+-transporting methylmalonyl-CoA/oxaloacetate decarboxylase gamma subunit